MLSSGHPHAANTLPPVPARQRYPGRLVTCLGASILLFDICFAVGAAGDYKVNCSILLRSRSLMLDCHTVDQEFSG